MKQVSNVSITPITERKQRLCTAKYPVSEKFTLEDFVFEEQTTHKTNSDQRGSTETEYGSDTKEIVFHKIITATQYRINKKIQTE